MPGDQGDHPGRAGTPGLHWRPPWGVTTAVPCGFGTPTTVSHPDRRPQSPLLFDGFVFGPRSTRYQRNHPHGRGLCGGMRFALPERVNVRGFNFTSRPASISTAPEVESLSMHQPTARTRAAARPLRCVVSCGGVVSPHAKRHAHHKIVGRTLPPTPTPALKKHLRPALRFVLRRATHAQGEPSCRTGVRPLGTGSPLPLCAIWSGQRAPQLGVGLPSSCPSPVLSCARAY